ncbi:MAG TPA: hypothetical protein VN965_08855 [Candidatus Dormibacteraeota bacterium]|nr:hypothetical protein [Candidatus Dormibacteraeota bacterium]
MEHYAIPQDRLISAHQKVIGEYDKLRDALLEGPANWMPGMYESATGKITELEADTTFGRLARYARMKIDRAQVETDEVVVPVTWHSLESEALFPTFEGRLRLYRAPDGTSRLELDGHYSPPGGFLGRAADAAALYAVAHATVEDFVKRIAGVLARNALGRSVAEQVDAKQLTLDGDPTA